MRSCLLSGWRVCGRKAAPDSLGLGTHVTELVPGGAEPGAGGFAKALVLTVAVAPSGQDSLHLGTERGLSKQPEPLHRLLWGGGTSQGRAPAPPEGAAQGGAGTASGPAEWSPDRKETQGSRTGVCSWLCPLHSGRHTPSLHQAGWQPLPLSSDPPQSQAGIRLQGWVWTATGCVTQGHHAASQCLSCHLQQLLLFTQKPPWTPHAQLTGGAEIRGV